MQTAQIELIPTMRAAQAQRTPDIAVTPEIEALLKRGAVAAYGISGGKDGLTSAVIANKYLDSIGHTGPRICVHADLGRVEWRGATELCQMQADYLGLELLVVKRAKGGLMERWLERWEANVTRYAGLQTAKLVLPWSTPSMRFCTGELKGQQIARALKKRYPDRPIINILGIRREESASRAAKAVSSIDKLVDRPGLPGMVWYPAIEFKLADVLTTNDATGLRRHEAYTVYRSTRFSCIYCILASLHDLQASARCADNVDVYREMVGLEADSSFSFQSGRWLADIAPHLLDPALLARVARAKEIASERTALEDQLPAHLMFENHVPLAVPSLEDAATLARVRVGVAAALGITIGYTTAEAVRERCAELIANSLMKKAKRTAKPGKAKPAKGEHVKPAKSKKANKHEGQASLEFDLN